MIRLQIHIDNSPRRLRPKRRRITTALSAVVLTFPIVALAAPLDIPNSFQAGDTITASDFNDNFDAVASAVNDNDERLSDVESAIEGVSSTPSGAVVFFNLATCPDGWTEMTGLRGRVPMALPNGGTLGATVGIELDDEGTRVITQVPSHSHTVNPPSSTSSATGSHSHGVDPPSTTTNTNGEHSHVVRNGNGGAASNFLQAANSFGDEAVPDSPAPITPNGAHTHSVNIPPFTSSSAGYHSHTVDIPSFTSSNTGISSVDVTMPYMQLLACSRN